MLGRAREGLLMDKKIFNNCFDFLVANFGYRFESEQEAMVKRKAFYDFLSANDFTDELIRRSTNNLAGSFRPEYGRRFPTVADFLTAVGAGPEALAEKALKYAKKRAITHAGEPLVPKNTKKSLVMVDTIREMGGWVKFCRCERDSEGKRDNAFKATYIRKYNNGDFNHEIKPLLGPSDYNNSQVSPLALPELKNIGK